MAEGNLSVNVPLVAGDHGSMMAQLEAMRVALTHIVTEVREALHSVADFRVRPKSPRATPI